MRERTARGLRASLTFLLALLVVVASLTALPAARAGTNPPLPVAVGSRFLGNLSAPNLDAGASGSVSFTLSNPLLAAISSVSLSLEVYAFNAFPGNANSTLAGASPPVLTVRAASGPWANYSVASLGSGAQVSLSANVETSSATAVGAFAVRSALSFHASNGTIYRLASRGWFTSSQWAQATELPNGSAVLDNQSLAILNISGILPETSIQVTSSALGVALYVVLGIVFVLVGLGAYFYFARTRQSSSGPR